MHVAPALQAGAARTHSTQRGPCRQHGLGVARADMLPAPALKFPDDVGLDTYAARGRRDAAALGVQAPAMLPEHVPPVLDMTVARCQ